MSETVQFRSRFARSQYHLIPESEQVVGGRHILKPCVVAEFKEGQFQTDDPTIIELIRKTPAYKRKEIIEIGREDKEVVEEIQKAYKKTQQKKVRGTVSTEQFQKEAGVEQEENSKPSLSEGTTKCDICGKSFDNDIGGKRLRMHKIAHRRKSQKDE